MAAVSFPVIQGPDDRLTTPCEAVPETDIPMLKPLLERMFATMYEAGGIGLAANQVGQPHRMFVVDVAPKSQPLVFINPEILEAQGQVVIPEGCLSFPGQTVEVSRASLVRVRALNAEGQPFEGTATGILAICIQHELDHLDGITMAQRASMQR